MPKNPKNKPRKGLSFTSYIKILILSLFFISLIGFSGYQFPEVVSNPLRLDNIPSPALYPENRNILPFPQISAEGVYIMDLQSAVVLYEKNARKLFPPASTTKVVTALMALSFYNNEDILEVKTVVNEGRLMGLQKGERISAENLIYAALIHSANDAAYTLAENYPGGVTAYIDKMNDIASEVGLKDTHFTNPIGFEEEGHYTTAYDLAQISRLALKNKTIKKIISTKIISVADENYTIFHTLENVNALLGRVPGVAGIKTGYTKEAGEVLSTIIKRDNHEVLIVLLKSQDRFGETESLIKWIFANFKWVNLQPT